MRPTTAAFAAAVLTVSTSAALAHPGHGSPVTDVASLAAHWLGDPVHLGLLALTGLAGAIPMLLLARRRARARIGR